MTEAMRFTHLDYDAREPIHYTACGLENVYLASGYQERVVDGETYLSVTDVEDLHEAIAVALTRQRKVLSGPEIRFIRKYLDLTQRGLGELLAVSDQSVARYEKGQTPLDGPGDGLLRLLVAEHAGGKVRIREELEKIRAYDDMSDQALTFELTDDDEWRSAA
jgi:DNA-binding transcriptional regulator YiaG